MHEMDVHAYLSQPGHDNIARLQCVLEDDARFYIVQEYCDGGELFDLIRAQGRMPEAVAREYARHMVHGASPPPPVACGDFASKCACVPPT